MTEEKKLTAKQELFCKEYLVDLNSTQAAIRAGYSEKTAYSIGSENLSKPEIRNRIQEMMDERAEKVEITAEYVLGSIKKALDSSLADDDRTNIYKGSELLGKHLKLFTDRFEQSGSVTININSGIDGGPNSQHSNGV